MGGKQGDVDIINVNSAVGCANDSADGVKQSGFADAGWAGDSKCLSSGNYQRKIVHDDGVAERNRKIRNLKHDS